MKKRDFGRLLEILLCLEGLKSGKKSGIGLLLSPMNVDRWLEVSHVDKVRQGETSVLRQMIEYAIKMIAFHLFILCVLKKSSASPMSEPYLFR